MPAKKRAGRQKPLFAVLMKLIIQPGVIGQRTYARYTVIIAWCGARATLCLREGDRACGCALDISRRRMETRLSPINSESLPPPAGKSHGKNFFSPGGEYRTHELPV